MEALRARLGRGVDPASFVAFRVGFGLLIAFSAARFVARGWVHEFLLRPEYHFGFLPFVSVPPPPVLYGLFAVQIVAGLLVATGRFPRAALTAWLAAFGWVELLDKSLYLNHYVLLSLLGLWLLVSPVHRVRLRGGPLLPTWSLWLLRLQVASVYVWAGLAKLNADWLLRGEPLATWLGARIDLPGVGPLLAQHSTALAMSWAGAVYDLSIAFLLLIPRTRPLALIAVLGFHAVVGLLFPIGVFPAAMVLAATLLLSPSWPRRFVRDRPAKGPQPRPLSTAATVGWVATCAFIVLFPARFLLYGPDVAWTERGFRFAWRVMLIEKTGLVDYRVVERSTGRVWKAAPSRDLTMVQHKEMRTRPDMIRQYALHLRDQHGAEGRDVAVYVDAWASLNGRPTQRLIDPEADLTRPLRELNRRGWIVPLQRNAAGADRVAVPEEPAAEPPR